MNGEEMDKALHDVITTIWQAYRKDCKTFNSCFAGLYEKYPDNKPVENLIIGMGIGLAPAVRAKVKEGAEWRKIHHTEGIQNDNCIF